MNRRRLTTTKRDLARQVGASTGIPMLKAEKIISATLEAISRSVKSGQRVELRNFGVFHQRSVKARSCAGMHEGAEVRAHVRFGFRTSGILRDLKGT